MIAEKEKSFSIKALRVDRGMTQNELADKLGVTPKTISAWENSEVPIKPFVIYALAYVLNVDAEVIRK